MNCKRKSLLAIALILFSCGKIAQSRQTTCHRVQAQLRVLRIAIENHFFGNDRYPDSLEELIRLGEIDPESSLRDPWGQAIWYRKTGSGYELFSCGPDRTPHTDDDVYFDGPRGSCASPSFVDDLAWKCSSMFSSR